MVEMQEIDNETVRFYGFVNHKIALEIAKKVKQEMKEMYPEVKISVRTLKDKKTNTSYIEVRMVG